MNYNIRKSLAKTAVALFMAITMCCCTILDVSAATVSYDQRNSRVKSYMDHVSYYKKSYSISYINKYLTSGVNYDKPAGYKITVAPTGIMIAVSRGASVWKDTVTPGGTYTIYNLIPGEVYTYTVYDALGQAVQTGSLKPCGAIRMIYLNSKHNFRDLGGWKANGGKIRYGRLIRGAALLTNENPNVSESDLAILSERVGVKCEIDLRKADEICGEDGTHGTEDDIDHTLIPGASYTRYCINSYNGSITRNKSGYKNLVKALRTIMNNAVAGKTTYFHCQVGADRTGTVAFMLEGLLGVSQSNMDKEYELTSFNSGTYRPRNSKTRKYKQLVSYMKSVPGKTWEDKFIQWFSCAGFTTREMNAFRKAMIVGKPKVIKSVKHKYGSYKTIKAATIFKAGTQTKTCSICKANHNKAIPKLKATIHLSSSSKSITRGSSFTLKVSYSRGDSVQSVSASNSCISVSRSGNKCVVKARKRGSATVRVKLKSGKTATCRVTVKNRKVSSTSKKTSSTVTSKKVTLREKLMMNRVR